MSHRKSNQKASLTDFDVDFPENTSGLKMAGSIEISSFLSRGNHRDPPRQGRNHFMN